MQSNYDILIKNLDAFIRKYYTNLVIRGSLYALTSLLVLYLIIAVTEYFAHLSSGVRAFLFFSFVLFNGIVTAKLIILPLLKMYKLGSVISHEKAAAIIGAHFPEIEDKLLNILQLKKMADTNSQVRELIAAGIEQKIQLIQPFSFINVIDLRKNKKYLKFATPPLLLLLLLLLTSPAVITDSTKRLVNYSATFERPAPFELHIMNDHLNALQNEIFILDVSVTGKELPDEVYLNTGGNTFLLQKKRPSHHQYTFRNIQRSQKFYLSAAGYNSPMYEITVKPKPIILNFDIELTYPAYTNKSNEVLSNTGDLMVPQGTRAQWNFHTRDTRHISFYMNDSLRELQAERENYFTMKKRLMENASYSILTANEYVSKADSMAFGIKVIPDAYPEIEVEEFRDTLLDKNLFFAGSIKDDYGFNKLTFNYRINKSSEADASFTEDNIEINPQVLQQQFHYHFNMNNLPLAPGDEVSYYFEVWDNDAVNGSKSIRTPVFTYKTLSREEIQQKTRAQTQQLHSRMEDVMNDVRDIQKSIDDLNRKVLESKTLNWQDRKNIEELLQKSRELQKNTEEIQKQFEQKEQWEDQYKELNEELLRKQEELNKLMEELMTDEMKELLEELEKMLDELDRNKVKDMLEQLQFNAKDVELQLDRSLELMRQFEVEKKLAEAIEKLEELAQKQKELSEKSSDRSSDSKELLEEQEKLNEMFEEVQQDISDMHEKNMQLQRPNKLDRTDDEQSAIEQMMQESSEQLEKNNKRGASDSQEDAAQSMQQLSQKLQSMQEQMTKDNLAEDARALRMILENLLRTSFAQEDLMMELRHIRTTDPRYVELIQKQNKIGNDLEMIRDSLIALSKRQAQIESYVNRELTEINSNLEKAVQAMIDRRVNEGASRQQFVMTHVNNLALMLSESLENMQMQMAAQGEGGSCSQPGGDGDSFRSLREMQEALNQMLQDLKDGKDPMGQQGQSLSEQLARAAAQQQAIRNHLRSMAEELRKQGQDGQRDLESLQKEMEETEADIVNRRLTERTLLRQQDILTRLLEHERAEREREYDEQREAEQAKSQKISNPNEFLKYKRLKEKEEELLRTVPPTFNIFYRNKVNEYFYNFQE